MQIFGLLLRKNNVYFHVTSSAVDCVWMIKSFFIVFILILCCIHLYMFAYHRLFANILLITLNTVLLLLSVTIKLTNLYVKLET